MKEKWIPSAAHLLQQKRELWQDFSWEIQCSTVQPPGTGQRYIRCAFAMTRQSFRKKKEWKWIAGSSNLCLFKHYTLSALYATALLWSCYFSTTVNNFIEAILSILGKLTKKQWERVERVTESDRENFIYILENRKYDPMYVSMCMHRYLQYSMHVCLFAFTDK